MQTHCVLRNVSLIGLTGLLSVHFLFTLAATLPPTPLATEYGKTIDDWMHPYFDQSWSFFAPTPPTDDDFVITQYRYRSPSGSILESPRINLSRTLNEVMQRDRLSSLAIVQATVSSAYCDLARSDLFKDGKLDEALLSRLMAANRRPPSLHILERAAMSCYRLTGLAGTPVAVRVGVLNHEFPRFTHRNEQDNEAAHNVEVEFPFVPFEAVASFSE